MAKSKRGRAGTSPRKSSPARKRSTAARKTGKARGRTKKKVVKAKSPRSRGASPVDRVKRVATGVVHQATHLGEAAVESVSQFVHNRF